MTFDLRSVLLANHSRLRARVKSVLSRREAKKLLLLNDPHHEFLSSGVESRQRRFDVEAPVCQVGISLVELRDYQDKRERVRSRRSKKEATQDGREKEENREPFRWETRKTARSSFADKSRDLFRGLRKLIRRSDSSVPPLDSNLQQAFHGFRRRVLDLSDYPAW